MNNVMLLYLIVNIRYGTKTGDKTTSNMSCAVVVYLMIEIEEEDGIDTIEQEHHIPDTLPKF